MERERRVKGRSHWRAQNGIIDGCSEAAACVLRLVSCVRCVYCVHCECDCVMLRMSWSDV